MSNPILLEAYVPTKDDMESFEDDLLSKPNEAKGEEVDIIDILSRISPLEKYQRDILMLLQSMKNCLHILFDNPLDRTCK